MSSSFDHHQVPKEGHHLQHKGKPLKRYAQLAYEHKPNEQEVYEDGFFDPNLYDKSDEFVNQEYLSKQKHLNELDRPQSSHQESNSSK
jgi:hypothetical protein